MLYRHRTGRASAGGRGYLVLALLVLVFPFVALGLACEEQPEEESAQQMELFAELTPPEGFPVPSAPEVVRWRAVTVNFDLLATATAGPIVFNLFDDVRLNVLPAGTQPAPSGQGRIWTGQVENETNGRVNLVINDGILTGEIHAGRALYRVRYMQPGVHVVLEIDRGRFGPD